MVLYYILELSLVLFHHICCLEFQQISFKIHLAHTHTVRGLGQNMFSSTGPYPLPTHLCGIRFIHPFYTLATPTLFVAGYDLIKAAKLVIDSGSECVWSRWLPFPIPSTSTTTTPNSSRTIHTLLTDAPSTIADNLLNGCLRLVGVDDHNVEIPSTESRILLARL